MVKFYDISNWNSPVWAKPPKGSRAQRMVEQPETGEVYYFKKSHHRNPSEIWSEILASKIGQTIGYNVLDYNLAFRNNEFGCLSKNMIDREKEEILYHGVDILSEYFDDFVLSDKPTFSFQDIKQLCTKNESFSNFLERFIEIMLLDALIGNTDRHTENWAFILHTTELNANFSTKIVPKKRFSFLKTLWLLIIKGEVNKEDIDKNFEIETESTFEPKISFSQIYDSGSCLGREIQENRILNFVNDENQIERYLNSGKSEIRWNDEQIGLFNIIERVKEVEPLLLNSCAKKIFDNLTNEKIQDIVENADICVKDNNLEHFLSPNRKMLIQVLLKKRLGRLKNIIQN